MAVRATTVPAVYAPDPVPLLTVRVYVAGLYVAVTELFAAGMVRVVLTAKALATVAPVHWSNTCPAGDAFAEMLTTCPFVYVPLPVPPTTVSV